MAGQSNDYFKEFDKIFKGTSDTEEQVNKVKEAIESINKFQIKINNKQALKNISETQKSLNQIKQNVVIAIAAKNAAKESINKIKKDLKSIVTKPFTVVIEAKNQTKKVIDGIKNLKNVVLSDSNKKIFNATIGEAMKTEDSFMAFKTNFKNEKDAHSAFGWANNEANNTQFKASEVRDSVAKLAASGLDYNKYFIPLGNFATANNKSMNDAIEAMSKLSGGNLKDATNDFTKLGITKDMWQKQGIKVDKDGVIQGNSKQAMDAAVRIMDSNWNGAMKNKSNTASGQMKNIKEGLSGLGTSLVGVKDNGEIEKGGVFDTFKQQLSKILPLLDKFKKSDAFKVIQKDLNSLVTGAGTKFSKFIEGLMKDPSKLKKEFNNLWPSIRSGISAIISLGLAATSLLAKLRPIFDIMAKHPKTVIGLFAAFKIGIPIVSAVITAFEKFSAIREAFSILSISIRLFSGASIKALLSFFSVLITNPVGAVIAGIILGLVLLNTNWKSVWDGISAFTRKIIDELMGLIRGLTNFLSDPIGSVKNLSNDLGKRIRNGEIVDKHALGTSYFHGGWTWVGEQGPELMKLPGGTQIVDNRKSQAMAGSSLSISKLADTIVVREDADIDKITYALANKLTNVGFNCV